MNCLEDEIEVRVGGKQIILLFQFDNQRAVRTVRTLSCYSLPLDIDLQMPNLILK